MKVAIFIDGQNFHRQWLDQADGYPFDWSWLMKWVMKKVGGDELFGVHYYSGDLPGSGIHTFMDKLERTQGFFVRRFPLKKMKAHCPLCDKNYEYAREKEVDTTIVADIVRMAAMDVFDVAVLMSGDGDLAPALETARLFGKKTWAATWTGGLSHRIKEAAFGCIDLMDAIDIVQKERQDELDAEKEDQINLKTAEDIIKTELESLKNEALAKAKSKLASLKEDHLEPVKIISKPEQEKEQVALSFTMDELYFMEGLIMAAVRLPFVGVGYFLGQWDMGADILETREERQNILDALINRGVLELRNSPPEGGQHITFKNKPANIDRMIQEKLAGRTPIGTFADAMHDVVPIKKG